MRLGAEVFVSPALVMKARGAAAAAAVLSPVPLVSLEHKRYCGWLCATLLDCCAHVPHCIFVWDF